MANHKLQLTDEERKLRTRRNNRKKYLIWLAANGKKPYVKFTEEEKKARQSAARKRWRAANPNREKELRRAALIAGRIDIERVRKIKRDLQKAWVEANPERAKEIHKKAYIKYKHGLTISEYEAMVVIQENRCAICKTDKSGKYGWHIDHCHKTGAVRKLLCHNCNRGLGNFKDDISILRNAIGYLEEFQST